MSKSLKMTDTLHDYVIATSVREHSVLKRCREETATMGGVSIMQISPEQGAFMAMTAQLMQAKRYIEVGTFTGYSALAVGLVLPRDGRADTLDISDEYMERARAYWAEAGVETKVTGHVAPAFESLRRLLDQHGVGHYDFAFIDADKASYDVYYEFMLKLVRPGGLIAIDNVLWFGRVIDQADQSADTLAIRALNAKIKDDQRVDTVLLPMADGIFLCRKR